MLYTARRNLLLARCKMSVRDLGDKKFLTVQQKEKGFAANRKREEPFEQENEHQREAHVDAF